MDIYTLDFETYFDDDYTLKKMTTEEYIRDARFDVHGCGVRDPSGVYTWFDRDNIGKLHNLPFHKAAVLCQHAHFDGLILAHHFGIKPYAWLDTLSMARLVLGTHVSASLDSLAKHYELNAKNVPYDSFRGKRWTELSTGVRQLLADGCLHDVALTYDIFTRLAQQFPVEEYPIVDATIRMFTEPRLQADIDMLRQVWTDEEKRKNDLLAKINVPDSDLQSADKFAELLKAEGVEPATKPGKNGDIYAFAKTDDFMRDLLESDNERAALLAQARLGIKSTIDQTRAERLGSMATRGDMCVYLAYNGAHTTRWSGGDKVNWQNLPKKGGIIRSIKAREGDILIGADASQIECRILNYLAGQQTLIDRFANNEDPYASVASYFYGYPVNKKDHPTERQLGKVIELACGYGMGALKLKATCKNQGIILDEAEALRGRDAYRATHPNVVQYWSVANRLLARLAGGSPLQWGPMELRDGRIYLPNGAWLDYTTIEYSDEWKSWRIRRRKGWGKIYGGLLVENVVQALARVVISQAMMRVKQRIPDIFYALLKHDEVVACVKDDSSAIDKLKILEEELSRSPTWMPGIPLGCEGFISHRYAK